VSGPVEDTRYVLRVELPPDAVLAALVDFSPERQRVWRETSHPSVYRVHEVGQTWADVTEGIPFSWSRERYDWSRPGIVTLTQLDSNVARDGTIRYEIEPDGAGSRITCTRHREFFGARGRLAGTVMRLIGPAVLKSQLGAGLERSRPAGG